MNPQDRDTSMENDLGDRDDFDFEVADPEIKEVYSDDSFRVVKPLDIPGLIQLSAPTTWLGHCSGWGHSYEYGGVQANHYLFRRIGDIYVIISRKNDKKRYMIVRGSSSISAPSGAEYGGAAWLAKNGTRGLQMFFVEGHFPRLSKLLLNKMGGIMLGDSTKYVYPSQFPLNWQNRANATKIGEIEIQPGTKTVKDLGGFKSVRSVMVPEGVRSIGVGAFEGMSSLASVSLPSTLTTIGSLAFSCCPQLRKLFIPKSVKTIKGAIASCSAWVYFGSTYDCVMQEVRHLSEVRDRLTFYCEADSRPEGWSEDWNTLPNMSLEAVRENYNRDPRWYVLNPEQLEEAIKGLQYDVVWGATRADAGLSEGLSDDTRDDPDDIESQLEVSEGPSWKQGRDEFVNSIRRQVEARGAEFISAYGMYPARKDCIWDNEYVFRTGDGRFTVSVFTGGETCIIDAETGHSYSNPEDVGIYTDEMVWDNIGFEDDKPYQYGDPHYRYGTFVVTLNDTGDEWTSNDMGYDDGESIDWIHVDEIFDDVLPEIESQLRVG